jgi:hypothetical protein
MVKSCVFFAVRTDFLNTGDTKELHTYKIIQKTNAAYLELHTLHQSIEKLSKFCTHLTETRYVLRESHDKCRDDNPNSSQTL